MSPVLTCRSPPQLEGHIAPKSYFSTTINIERKGHGVLHLDRYDEDHVITMPPVHVEGIMTFQIAPDHLERRIAAVRAAGQLRPRAVIGVDLFGNQLWNHTVSARDVTLIVDGIVEFGPAPGRPGRTAITLFG